MYKPTLANSFPLIVWTTNGIPINVANNPQIRPKIISDGVGGAIIVWEDGRNLITTGVDIYAQRIDADGNFLWDPDGIAISTADNDQSSPELVSDGEGGAIITWTDRRSFSSTGLDIFAQRIDFSGVLLWTPNGTSICSANQFQQLPYITSDENGGAFIVWKDDRNDGIYAQKINSTGIVQWTINGIIIGSNAIFPHLISDGAGGVIVAWPGRESFEWEDFDIYAQKINYTGDVQWDINGVKICTAEEAQSYPQLASDGAGGAIIVWIDERNKYSTGSDIFTQKINAIGDVMWTPNGTELCTKAGGQTQVKIIEDYEEGAIIAWVDNRDIFIQKVNSSGDALWIRNGTEICTAIGRQEGIQLTSNGEGGAFVVWFDERGSDNDIYIQLINSAGKVQWELNGTPISTAQEPQEFPRLINNQGQIIIVWQDRRNIATTGSDIYAHKVIDNMRPISNKLSFINTTKLGNETIDWVLIDDWGEGQYRVKMNDSSGEYIIWQDWQPWINNTPIRVPINRAKKGIFNYTVEFYDIYNLSGDPDSVIVYVEEEQALDEPEDSPNIVFGLFFLIPALLSISVIVIVLRRKYYNK